jgi:hypothetical protein
MPCTNRIGVDRTSDAGIALRISKFTAIAWRMQAAHDEIGIFSVFTRDINIYDLSFCQECPEMAAACRSLAP